MNALLLKTLEICNINQKFSYYKKEKKGNCRIILDNSVKLRYVASGVRGDFMFEEMRVQTQYLEERMVLARDVEKDGILLIPKGTQLNRKMILQFVHNKISHVWVQKEVNTDNLKTYEENLDCLRNIIQSAEAGEEISIEEVQEITKKFAQVRSQKGLLRYIYGIRKADEYTYQHSLNVSYLAMMLGRWLKYPNLDHVAMAGLLHDLGKTKIDLKVLNKPGALNDDEWDHMKRHPILGYLLLKSNPEVPKEVLKGVMYHHERMDGRGYPQGLKADEVPEIARIIAIVDVFDAMTSDRVYHSKKDTFEVLKYMHDLHHEFDLCYLRVFTENMLDILMGEQVVLSNNQVGKIVFKNPYRPFSPLIQMENQFIDLSQEKDLKIERVL